MVSVLREGPPVLFSHTTTEHGHLIWLIYLYARIDLRQRCGLQASRHWFILVKVVDQTLMDGAIVDRILM
ncbi:hypothetical protein BHE74_00005895 [Ensete ventricosum]|nr:hypothetical protein GW17_00007367 [Ensete ventricosum]RWW85421.1 hypothetical protein BHE74_00005895 [Ensete ventricosum]